MDSGSATGQGCCGIDAMTRRMDRHAGGRLCHSVSEARHMLEDDMMGAVAAATTASIRRQARQAMALALALA